MRCVVAAVVVVFTAAAVAGVVLTVFSVVAFVFISAVVY